MAIDLIPLLWASLHSSHPRWLPFRLHYDLHMRRGRLVLLRRHRWWILLLSDSIAVYFSSPHSSSLGSPPRSCLRTLWKVFLVSSTAVSPGASTAGATSSTPTVSLLPARSRSPCRTKRPLVLLRPRGDCFIRGDWRSSWFAERQVCSVLSVPLFNNNFPSFPRPLTIDPAGRACLTQVGTVVFWLVRSLLRRRLRLLVRVFLGLWIQTGTQDVSALGESFAQYASDCSD